MKVFSKMFLVLINLILIFNVKSSIAQVNEENITNCSFCNNSEVNKTNYYNYEVPDTNEQHQQSKIAKNFEEKIIKSTSIGYGVILLANNYVLSNSCYTEMVYLYNAIQRKDTWAIKALDASGSPDSGFVWGNNYWLGSECGCNGLNEAPSITLSDRFKRNMKEDLMNTLSPYNMEYKIVHAKHASPWQIEVKFLAEQILHIGLCLPKSCTNEEVTNLTQLYFDKNELLQQTLYDFSIKILQVKNLKLNNNFYTKYSVILLGIAVFVTIILTILAALQEAKVNEIKISDNNNTDNASTVEQYSNVKMIEENFSYRIIKCFNVKDNFNSIKDVRITPESIPVIDGIRSIACFWIFLFHMNWFSHYATDNAPLMFALGEKSYFLFISNGPVLVDMFFSISGFLLSYNFLRNDSRMMEVKNNNFYQNIKLFGKLLLHRYIRLTPLCLLVISFVEISNSYMADVSKFWIHERNDLNCQNYWWRNLLYIHNFFDFEDLCVNWTWSLACEMQFFIIYTPLLFYYIKNPSRAKKLYLGSAAIITCVSVAIALNQKFVPTFDVLYDTGNALYIPPYSRIHPYMVGFLAGWYVMQNQGKLVLRKRNVRLLWTVAITVIFSTLHSTYKRDIQFVIASCLLILSRALAGGCVSWIIIASLSGYKSWVNTILEQKIFIHINKLTYAIYLLHPMLITLIAGLRDNAQHTEPLLFVIMGIGIAVLVYLLAILCSLFFELPYCKLSNELLMKRKVKTK